MQTDKELITHALNMWANHIETGNVSLNAGDADNRKMKVKALDDDQKALVLRLRKLARDNSACTTGPRSRKRYSESR